MFQLCIVWQTLAKKNTASRVWSVLSQVCLANVFLECSLIEFRINIILSKYSACAYVSNLSFFCTPIFSWLELQFRADWSRHSNYVVIQVAGIWIGSIFWSGVACSQLQESFNTIYWCLYIRFKRFRWEVKMLNFQFDLIHTG